MLGDRGISVGDYVLSGGELGAAVIVDAVVRLLRGALGHPDSARFESFGLEDTEEERDSENGPPRTTYGSGGLLDYPHYTRPAEFEGVSVPEVLQGGNHDAIRAWRRRMALQNSLSGKSALCGVPAYRLFTFQAKMGAVNVSSKIKTVIKTFIDCLI